jgi:hypothetical protein
MPYPSKAALALIGSLLAMPVAAQAPAAPPSGTVAPGAVGATVDGSPPARAGATTAVGRTKPPGAAAAGTRPDLDDKSRRLDRKIRTGICKGC